MARDEPKTEYQRLLERCSVAGPSAKSAEEDLDQLLSGKGSGIPELAPTPPAGLTGSPLDGLRQRIRQELIPVFEELKEKYANAGIALSMDASSLFAGGRTLVIEFKLPTHAIRLEGTAVSDGIAFNEIQSYGGVPGVISSGAMLRTRLLSAERFREFLCSHLAPLVRTKLRQK